MGKSEELEAKIKQAVLLVATLRKENSQLKSEIDSVKTHMSLFNAENSKAHKIMADYEQIRRKHEVVTQKVERALSTLNAMRGAS